VRARRRVGRPASDLYAQLSDLRSHWDLAGRWVQPLELNHDGGIVRVRGPLGLRRTITTRLTELRPGERVAGEAEIGRTKAKISWLLEPDGTGTFVTLQAEVIDAGALDRALLALGGASWMRNRFDATLQRLG
jgi:hypothetical protein